MKPFALLLAAVFLLTACTPALVDASDPLGTPTLPAFATATPFAPLPATETPTATLSPTPEPTATPSYPVEGYGPANFPANINPLTGLEVADPAILERRPMAIKVSNLPRNVRPQWGLTRADLVFEYYIEEGSTRFIAVFYGEDSEQVGPIRSARLFDIHVVRMYDAIFGYASGDYRVRDRLSASGLDDRLVSEYPAKCPPMCRWEPSGANHLLTNTKDLSAYIDSKNVENGRQALDGMFFQEQVPANGADAPKLFARYSAAIYNRWDFDPVTGLYTRFAEADNDFSGNETYLPLTDRLNGEPVAMENVVIILIPHQYVSTTPEVVDIQAVGPGDAYAFRDGKMYKLRWSRPQLDSVFVLTYADGTPYPLKPGSTWFEVMGTSTKVTEVEGGWRFTFLMP